MSARRPWALPLVPLYRLASAFERTLRTPRKLAWPLISVGSLSAGGAGKTPVVIALANMLHERGWHVDVLSRGYGRAGSGNQQVDLLSLSTEQSAHEFGDEPTLIAQRTSAEVWVGSNRFISGTLAEEGHLSGLHILDDGFQHRRLARDFDIVLITAEDLTDSLLPAGNLREPLTELRRADAIVIRDDEHEAIEERVRALAGPKPLIWTIRRTLQFPEPLGVFGAGLRPLAFCALARPEDFASSLQAAGCGIIDTVIFDDHHRYAENDITQVLDLAAKLNATGFVTTEKDAVKLSPKLRSRLESFGPVMTVALHADFVYKAPVLRALEEGLRSSSPSHVATSRSTADTREALVS